MPEFVRVRDNDTRHEFDVPKGDSRIGKSLVDITSDRWPALSGLHARPRPPVHATDKAGQPAPKSVSTTKNKEA